MSKISRRNEEVENLFNSLRRGHSPTPALNFDDIGNDTTVDPSSGIDIESHLCRNLGDTPEVYGGAVSRSAQDATIGEVVTGEEGRSLYVIIQSHGDVDPASTIRYSPDDDHGSNFVELTLVEAIENDPGDDGWLELWRLDDPEVGESNASVRVNGGTGADYVFGVIYADTAVVRDLVAANSAGGTGSSVTGTTVAGDRVLDLGGWVENNATVDTPAAGASQTELATGTYPQSFGQPDFGYGISHQVASGVSTTAEWIAAVHDDWYAGMVILEGSGESDYPQDVGANGEAAVGTSVRVTRCDHVHAHSDLSDHDTEIHHHVDSILGATGDHGELTGLSDDDHTQYIKDSEFTATGDTLRGTGAGTFVRVKHNIAAAVAPTVNEDSGDGYAIGSRWLDTTADKEYVALDVTVGAAVWVETTGAGGSGAPDTADYLVGTAQAGLSAEIVVGATPGGELGNTWASPTVDATHSGSTHGAATTTHEAASDPHTGYVKESEFAAKGDLLGGTGSGTLDNLAAGTNGHSLVADSAETTGLKYAARLSTADHAAIDHGDIEGSSDWDTKVTADADQDVTDNATPQNSTEITIDIDEGVHLFEFTWIWSCSSSLAKARWRLQSSDAIQWDGRAAFGWQQSLSSAGASADPVGAIGASAGGTQWPAADQIDDLPGASDALDNRYVTTGRLTLVSPSGGSTITLQFGNNAAGAANITRLHIGSYLWHRQLAGAA